MIIFKTINKTKLLKFNYLFGASFGGILMGLTVAPVNFWWLAWIALIPLWLAIRLSKSWLTKILACIFWAIAYHGIALSWIVGIHPMTWMGVPWLNSLLIAVLCWLLITGWGVILVTIWGILINSLFNLLSHDQITPKNSIIKVSFGTIIWCLLEKVWSYSPLWWTSLAYTQSPHNLAILQLLKLSGITTVTSLILLFNFLLAEIIILSLNQRIVEKSSIPSVITTIPPFEGENLGKFRKKVTLIKGDLGGYKIYQTTTKIIFISIPFLILFSSHLLGYFLYLQPLNDTVNNKIKVGIIQGNIPNEIKLYDQGLEKAIIGYTRGYQELSELGVDLIITPETALPFYYNEIEQNSEFYQNILVYKTPVFLGAFDLVNNNYTNSLFLINGEGKLVAKYDKVNLVPLGEYIPFTQILGNLINRLSPLQASLIVGSKNQILSTPFGKVIVGICYDSAFPQHFRQQAVKGGEFIITSANNAHYSPSMPFQHHAQDIMRAIETDRWMARATNTGYSAIINPHGETIWISNLNQYQIHQGNIYRRQTKTLYVLWGDWLIKLFCLVLIFILYL